MNILLSIRTKYADAILAGTKRCEFRKAPLPDDVEKVIIYSSRGSKKIVGCFTIKKQVKGSPRAIWQRYSKIGGVTRKDFFDYFRGRKEAVCIEVKKVTRIEPPLDPYARIRGFRPPEFWRYVKESEYNLLAKNIKEMSSNRMP